MWGRVTADSPWAPPVRTRTSWHEHCRNSALSLVSSSHLERMETRLSEWWHWCHPPQGHCQMRDMTPASQCATQFTWGKSHPVLTATATHRHGLRHVGTDLPPLSPPDTHGHTTPGSDRWTGSSPACWDDHGWLGSCRIQQEFCP